EILGWTFRRTTRWRWDLLATRGERLALVRERLDHEGRTFGPTTLEGLVVAEVNAAGEYERAIVFDHADLDGRYLAGEAAPYARTVEVPQRLLRAAASRDWAQWLAAFTEDFVLEDHRRLGWGTRSLDEFLAQNRAMIDLSPDAKLRGDHIFAIDHGRALAVARWVGTRDGGPFEIPLGINVFAIDPDGRIRRMDLYDEEELATAQARYDALAIAAPVPRIENAATRWFDRFVAAWEAHDWDRVAAGFAPGFRLTDFQKMTLAELDRDQHLACLEWTFRRTTRWAWQVVATRGEGLALVREHLEHVGRTIGPTELEDLIIVEVNDAGAY